MPFNASRDRNISRTSNKEHPVPTSRFLSASALTRVTVTVAACLCLSLLGACAAKPRPQMVPEQEGEIHDLRTLPQDLAVYAKAAGATRRLLNAEEQERANARFDRLFWGPWSQNRATAPDKDVFAILGRKGSRPKARGYAENLLPWQQERWDALAANANRSSYPSRADKAITVRETHVRELPTQLPRFAHPTDPGQGYPFDLFEYATLHPGTPVLITHRSRDNAWLYVETALISGWVLQDDIALTDEAFREAYRADSMAAIVRDGVRLEHQGRFLAIADVGAILPIVSADAAGITVRVPERDLSGYARITSVRLDAADAAPKPLPLTPEQVAALGNAMMGQPYGWGGLLGNRDCSLLLRDLFVPFGVWLPRNSVVQSKAWDRIPFGNISPAEKEARILREAVPFATLLWMPGHIALYVGEYEGQAVMYHSFWGIRTKGPAKTGGRFVIGRVAVTSTRPGVELPNVESRDGLLGRMGAMSILR